MKKPPHPLRAVWKSMKRRCYSPGDKFYCNYGARGIIVCDRWLEPKIGFLNFVADMGPRPDGHSIDRINNDGPYSPDNCRWATRTEQQRNQRCTRKVIIDGVQYLAVELAERAGIKTDTVVARAADGLGLADVLRKQKRIYAAGLALGGKANGARQRAKTHCPQGHEYTPDNLVANKNGYRRCKTCHRERAAEKRAA